MLSILGFILAILGILGLVNLLPIPLAGSILLIIGGVLLVAYARGAIRH